MQLLSKQTEKRGLVGLNIILKVIFIVLLFCSCATPYKQSSYLQKVTNDTAITSNIKKPAELRISKNDILAIQVSSLNAELDAKFNALALSGATDLNSSGVLSGHEVDSAGNIRLHFLGEIHVEGFTRNQLSRKLENELIPFLKDPIVKVQFLNKKVTVMGEVGSPKIISLKDEYIHILDALVLSGDIKEDAIINDVILIRDSSNAKQIKHLNLEDQSLLGSDWSLLLPNDVLYLRKDITNKEKEAKRMRVQTILTISISFINLIVILLNVIIK